MTQLSLALGLGWIAAAVYFGGLLPETTMIAGMVASAYAVGILLVLKLGSRRTRA